MPHRLPLHHTPATGNCQNTSDTINNNNNDDVDCFPWQDKQPVLPQDISSTDTPPSLIESTTDTPTAPMNPENNNNNDRPDDDNNNSPDDDNDNDDVDCFPRQDKQPVIPSQDIPPTAPTANNTPPSFIESFPDTRPAPMNTDNNNNNNRRRTAPARTKQSVYRGSRNPTHTVVPKAPLLVWDGTQYQLDYNHDHRPIYVWDGTTHTDIVYADDEDYNVTNDYAHGDPFNMNDSSNQLQFIQCLHTVQFQNRLQAIPQTKLQDAIPQAIPQATTTNTSKHTTMKNTHTDPQPSYKYDTLQLLFLTTHHEENIETYDNEFTLYTIPT